MGLSGSLALLGGLEAVAGRYPPWVAPGESGPARLNANENPYGPSPAVREVITKNLAEACRYPFATLGGLVREIAEKEGVPEDHIVVTGGSTEGLKAAGLLCGIEKGEVIAADPTFQALLHYAEHLGSRVHRVPLNERLEHDLEAMSDRINPQTRMIFLCNPNNPSGTLLDPDALTDFCRSYEKQAVIFSDEAYYDFITLPDYPSMTTLVLEGRNVIVSKTFSKVYGLAGMRLGYLIARPDIAGRLKQLSMAGTNTLAIAAASAALRDTDFYTYSLGRNAQAKNRIYETLQSLEIPYLESHTNFVFFRSGIPVSELIAEMKERQVLIGRPFPPLTDWARVSTGTLEHMELFSHALSEVIRR